MNEQDPAAKPRGDEYYLRVYPHSGRAVAEARGLKRLLYRVLPRYISRPLMKELALSSVKLRGRSVEKRYRGARDLMVNIGVGNTGHKGWVNVDAYPHAGVTCVYDARRRLPFPMASVRAIFCEHFFEHLDYTEEVPDFLSECHRVLQPGGVLRLIVPDTEEYLRAYVEGGWDKLDAMRPLEPGHIEGWSDSHYTTRMELLNVVFRSGFSHRWAYDHETMEFVLKKYGFGAVKRQQFGQSLLPELCLDQKIRESESLYVEAVR